MAASVRRAYLGLGSNMGDRRRYLQDAVGGLAQLDAGLAVSPVYETEPVGGPPGQRPYLNCVVRLRTALDPLGLLGYAQQLEQAAGRVRTVVDGPRTLDVDVLLIDGVEMDDDVLTVPHPRMRDRAFVLAPLEDLDPDIVPAGWRDGLGGEAAVSSLIHKLGTLFPS